MGRTKEPFIRNEKYLDARKIFVIAFEGAEGKAEDRYFSGLQNLANSLCKETKARIHIKSIPNTDDKSAPSHIFENLKSFKESYNLDYDDDESFMLVDWDRHQANIDNYKIVQRCKENDFHLLLCNPCFELWLLLHFIDVHNENSDKKEKLYTNIKISKNRHYISKCLEDSCGSSNKSNLDFNKYEEFIVEAIKNARKLENNPNDPIPAELTARVYIVVEKILNDCK